jgi:multicomponent Na+:H+ antiporter subunit G
VSAVLDFLTWLCLMAGAFLGIVGGIGMHRFPDFYSRLHAAGTTDTLCSALFVVGLMLQAGFSLESVKLFFIFALLYFASPTSTHCVAYAALHGGLSPRVSRGPEERNQC